MKTIEIKKTYFDTTSTKLDQIISKLQKSNSFITQQFFEDSNLQLENEELRERMKVLLKRRKAKENIEKIEKDDDLFYNNEVFDKLAGFGNKRYMNIVDERNKSELDDNKDMAQYKDMEVNINDFNFNENDNITEENGEGKEDNEFNYVNYWKNDLEKEKNSYVNILGEEAMKDLLEE